MIFLDIKMITSIDITDYVIQYCLKLITYQNIHHNIIYFLLNFHSDFLHQVVNLIQNHFNCFLKVNDQIKKINYF